MRDLKEYTIPFVGLKLGKHHFEYEIDNSFFEHFEYDEFNAVSIASELLFEKKTTLLELSFNVNGSVNVNCDLTNEPFDLPIDGEFKLVVKFGSDYNDDNEEILIIPHGEYEINVAQYIYELIVLSVPQKKIHPGVEDGTLESDILKKLEELSPKLDENNDKSEDIDPRWQTLKKLLTDK
ncbi:YceD family protein [Winogradskyella sp. 3972H.M.0a.05]|uniref:YceD family protein n=1 Tax=Winogradskyella sp. 3972H.M.0a.05 TaxID=2950277 RepID=UPI00339B303C